MKTVSVTMTDGLHSQLRELYRLRRQNGKTEPTTHFADDLAEVLSEHVATELLHERRMAPLVRQKRAREAAGG